MKSSRYSDGQIINILKQAEAGTPVTELCREHGMSKAEVLNEAITKSGKAISSEEDGSTSDGTVWYEHSFGLYYFFDQ